MVLCIIFLLLVLDLPGIPPFREANEQGWGEWEGWEAESFLVPLPFLCRDIDGVWTGKQGSMGMFRQARERDSG